MSKCLQNDLFLVNYPFKGAFWRMVAAQAAWTNQQLKPAWNELLYWKHQQPFGLLFNKPDEDLKIKTVSLTVDRHKMMFKLIKHRENVLVLIAMSSFLLSVLSISFMRFKECTRFNLLKL